MPRPKFSLQFAFSWSVHFSNRTESYSSQIEFAGPHGITENQATYLHCGGEARAKKRARPSATCRKSVTVSLPEMFRGVNLLADYYHPQIVLTAQETAARREAEQLRVSQSRSTETVDKLQPGRKPNSFTFRNPGQPRRSK